MSSKSLLDLISDLPYPAIATVHKDPDLDAIGSLLALVHIGKQLGKTIIPYVGDYQEKKFHFLPRSKHIKPTIRQQSFSTAFILDCSDKSRIYQPQKLPQTPTVVNIDHHQDNTHFGDINIVLDASSVGEILYDELSAQPSLITPDIATYLYSAIMFDTGGLRFSNTTPRTLMAMAHLIQYAIDPVRLNDMIFDQKSELYFEEIKMALDDLYIDQTHPFILVTLPWRPKKSGHSCINFFRQYKGKEVIIVCNEIKKEEYKLSFRSKQYINVSKLAAFFNGGGHIRASGGFFKGAYDVLKPQLIAKTSEMFLP